MADIPVTVKFRVSNAKRIKSAQKSINALQKRISEMNKKMSAMTKQLNAGSKAFNRMNTSMNKTAKGAKNVGNRVGTMTKKVKKGKRSMEEFGASGIVTGLVFATLGAQAGQFGRQITDAMTTAVTSTAKLFGELQRVSAFSNNVFLPSGKIDYKAANEIKNLVFQSGLDTGLPFFDVATIYKEVEKGVPDNVDSKAFAKRIVELTLLENNLSPEKITADVITLASNFNLQIDEALDVITAFSKSTKLNLGAGSKAFGFAAGAAKRLGGTAQDLAKVLASIANQIPGFQGNAGRGLGNLLNNLTKPGVTDALASIGVNILDVEGNSIGLIKTLDLLAETYTNFENISDKARNVFLANVINGSLNANRALEAYVDTSVEERLAIQATVDNSAGLTARLINAQKETAEANLGKIKNQVDLLKISFSAGLFPAIKEVNQILTTLTADREFLGFIQDFGKAIGDEFVSLIRTFIKDLQNFKGVLLGLKPLLPIIAKALLGIVTSLHAFGVIGPVIGIAFGLSFAMKALSGSLLGSSGLALALKATSISFARFIGIIALAGLVVFGISRVITNLTSTAEDAVDPLETVAYALTAIGGATGILLLSGQLGTALALAGKLKSTLLGLPVVTTGGATGAPIKSPGIPTKFLTDFKTKVANVFKSLGRGVEKFGNAIIAIPSKIKGVGNSIRNALFGTAGGQAGFFSTTTIKKFVTDVKTIPSKLKGLPSAIHGAIFGTTAALTQSLGKFTSKIGTGIKGIGKGTIVGAAVIAGALIITAFLSEMNKRVEESEFFKTGLVDKWDQVGFQAIAATNVFLRDVWKLWVEFSHGVVNVLTDTATLVQGVIGAMGKAVEVFFKSGFNIDAAKKAFENALRDVLDFTFIDNTVVGIFDADAAALTEIEKRLNKLKERGLGSNFIAPAIVETLNELKIGLTESNSEQIIKAVNEVYGDKFGTDIIRQVTALLQPLRNTNTEVPDINVGKPGFAGPSKYADYLNEQQENFVPGGVSIPTETVFGVTRTIDELGKRIKFITDSLNVDPNLYKLNAKDLIGITQRIGEVDDLINSTTQVIKNLSSNIFVDPAVILQLQAELVLITKLTDTSRKILTEYETVLNEAVTSQENATTEIEKQVTTITESIAATDNVIVAENFVAESFNNLGEKINAIELDDNILGLPPNHILSDKAKDIINDYEDYKILNPDNNKKSTTSEQGVAAQKEIDQIITKAAKIVNNLPILQPNTSIGPKPTAPVRTDDPLAGFAAYRELNPVVQRGPNESYGEAEARQAALTASEAAAQGNYSSNLSQGLYGNTGGISGSQIYKQEQVENAQSALETLTETSEILNTSTEELYTEADLFTENVTVALENTGIWTASVADNTLKVDAFTLQIDSTTKTALTVNTALIDMKDAIRRAISRINKLGKGGGGIRGSTSSGFRSPTLAEGGIVTRATRAIIGERGPEAVIPLRELSGILNKSIDNNNSNSNKENNIVINFNPTINVTGNENIGETVKQELETIVENVLVSKLRGLAQ